MCGICGLFHFDGKPVTRDQLEPMNNTMRLRGPDDAGYHEDGAFGMAMRRLSIIDLAGGHQPLFNEEENIAVVLNGEIYNYIELRKDLIAKGHSFKTNSDVEVLCHLYEDFGLDAIHHLNGMFAFGLWDKKLKRLWVGRDRLGIKPLVYLHDHNRFAFASVLDALTTLEPHAKQIDLDGLLLYLTLSYVPAPHSIFKGIKKLLPGHYITVSGNTVTTTKYWDLPAQPDSRRTHQDFLEQTNDLLKHSVLLQSRSDVPVCCFLSGGIDSSAVTALFSQQNKKAVHTFSVDFEGKPTSDLHYAKLVADRYGTNHHPYAITPDTAFDCLAELLPLMDEPMADSAIMPSYYLSKKTREAGVKVVLSGAGGDELFGGYFRHFPYKRDLLIGHFPWIPRTVWQNCGALFHSKITNYGLQLNNAGLSFALGTSGVDLGILQSLIADPALFDRTIELVVRQFSGMAIEKHRGFSYARMATDVRQYLVDNVLILSDKTSMAASVEARVPLLDHRLVELAFGTLPQNNIGANDYKRSLKKVVAPLLPKEILTRSKTGFNAPVQYWLKGEKRHTIFERLQKPSCPLVASLLNHSALEALCCDPRLTLRGSETLFGLYIFDLWHETHG